jgi:murein DD-endopeptidase MepM/ murein hydrolase activator NlpD
MTTWIRSVEGRVTSSFQDHKNRTPASRNPGTDYGVATGTPVKAIADGTISGIVETFRGAGGRMIFQSFAGGYNADYLHMSRIDVKPGQEVKQGQVIGLSGGSGFGSETGYAPHLHLAIRRGGSPSMGVGNIDFETLVGSAPASSVAPAKAAAAPKAPAKAKAPAKPKATAKTYTVVKGDNLTKIAKAHGTTVAALVKLNGIKDKNLINIGQVLKVG